MIIKLSNTTSVWPIVDYAKKKTGLCAKDNDNLVRLSKFSTSFHAEYFRLIRIIIL